MAETGLRIEKEECREMGVFNVGNRRLSDTGKYFLDLLWNGGGGGQGPVKFHVASRGRRFGHKIRNNLLRNVKTF